MWIFIVLSALSIFTLASWQFDWSSLNKSFYTCIELHIVDIPKKTSCCISPRWNSNVFASKELVGYKMKLELEFRPANRVEMFSCGFPN